MDVPPPAQTLPILHARRMEVIAERVVWLARPGWRALPSGTLAVVTFAGLQLWTMTILLWAIWWPQPISIGDYAFSIGASALLFGLLGLVVWLLLRRYPGFALAVMRAPFVRLTVTDRRLLWTVPWSRLPLMEIGRDRILGGILGPVDAKGYGSTAVMLVPGDPSADIDGNIHFDRLPDAAGFVAALRGL